MAPQCAVAGTWVEWFSIYCHAGLGPIYAAIITVLFLWIIAHGYTKRMKKNEATVEFSKRFQKLLCSQHKLNVEFYCDENSGQLKTPRPLSTAKDELDAWNLFRQFFDLMLHEFNFFQDRVISKKVFVGWMVWRWYDWHPSRDTRTSGQRPGGLDITGLETCGVTYQKSWKWWASRPGVCNPSFVSFMDDLHDDNNKTGLTGKKHVEQVVRAWAPHRLCRRRSN